jgi:tRNA(Ile)-lysidine synthase TilS/MesJ
VSELSRPYFATIWKPVGEAIADYGLISEGDVIGAGLSGGKDSLLLVWVLTGLRRISPVKFDVKALTVDLGWGDDLGEVQAFCHEKGVEHHTRRTNIGPVVFEQRKEENPCALCAHLRRGALNSLAVDKGCNKVALAHHLDDAIETLFLSMMFEGRIECFRPLTGLQRAGLSVIRPFVYVHEDSIVAASRELSLPVVKSSCPSAGMTRRQDTKRMIASWSREFPGTRNKLRACLESLWKRP